MNILTNQEPPSQNVSLTCQKEHLSNQRSLPNPLIHDQSISHQEDIAAFYPVNQKAVSLIHTSPINNYKSTRHCSIPCSISQEHKTNRPHNNKTPETLCKPPLWSPRFQCPSCRRKCSHLCVPPGARCGCGIRWGCSLSLWPRFVSSFATSCFPAPSP